MQLCDILEDIMEHNPVVGCNNISVHIDKSDNEASTDQAVYLYTNHVGSVRCVFYTISLAVNDVLEQRKMWKLFMNKINK